MNHNNALLNNQVENELINEFISPINEEKLLEQKHSKDIKDKTSNASPQSFRAKTRMSYSQKAMFQSCRFSIIEENISRAIKPHTFCQLLKNFLEVITSDDPNAFHYDIARKALYDIDEEALNNEHAIDMLARELLNVCCIFDANFHLPIGFAELFGRNLIPADYPYTSIVDLTNLIPGIDDHFFVKEGLTIWDYEYVKLLQGIGKTGKTQSKSILKKFNESGRQWNATFWFRTDYCNDEGYLFDSSAFLYLADVLWNDIIKNHFKKEDLNIENV